MATKADIDKVAGSIGEHLDGADRWRVVQDQSGFVLVHVLDDEKTQETVAVLGATKGQALTSLSVAAEIVTAAIGGLTRV